MADDEAHQLVRDLKARGWSGSAIAREIGRDASRVNQIGRDARGPGYGAHDVPALRQLAAGRPAEPPPRRVSATGEPARTRRPVVDTPAGRLVSARSFGPVVERELERAAGAGRREPRHPGDMRGEPSVARVYADIRTKSGARATGWRKGGIDPAVLLTAIRQGGGVEALRQLGGVVYLPDGDPIVSVDLTIAEETE